MVSLSMILCILRVPDLWLSAMWALDLLTFVPSQAS